MESGTPGLKATEDGWLNRAIGSIRERRSFAVSRRGDGAEFAADAPGKRPGDCVADVKQFKVMAQNPAAGKIAEGGFEAMYAQTVDQALRGTGTETFEAIDMLRKADPSKYQPENGADYPKSRLGQSLQQVGQLIKSTSAWKFCLWIAAAGTIT